MKNEIDKKYTEYAHNVLNGNILACEYVKLACQRYLNWMERDDMEFIPKMADKPIIFASKLKHFAGAYANKPFILLDWEKQIVYNIFGFYWKGTNKRVCRNVYIEIARKNGKSSLAALLCLYMLIADGEASPQSLLCANSFKQASISYEMCSKYIESVDPKGLLFKQTRDKIKFPANNGFLQVLSSEHNKLDGYSPSCMLVDEYHAARTSATYDVLKTGQGFREKPLAIVITTAGLSLAVPCYEMRKTNIEILSNVKQDDTTLAFIYTLDDGDNPLEDEGCWIKANPSLGEACQIDYLREMVVQAKNNPSSYSNIMTKNFNMWLTTNTRWLSDRQILDCTEDIDIEKFKGMSCYMSFDLASVSDLSALSVMIPYDGKMYFKTWYFLPAKTIEESPNRMNYKKWVREGKLIQTNGNATDYDYICNKIMEINNVLLIQKISYDAWNATSFAIKLTELGMPLQPYSQSLGNFNKPTKELERLILQNNVVIDNNIITRWCFSNCELKYDFNENVKPVKGDDPNQKIDGCITIIMCLGGMLEDDVPQNTFIKLT
jgi:phage terminase large subunit-like protein